MSSVDNWSTTAASNNSASPDGWPEAMAPSGVNDSGREMMAALRTQFQQTEWFNWGDTCTYASATSFTISGDVTSRYTKDREIWVNGATPGDIYGKISSSSYAAPNTTVNVDFYSGSMSSETLTVYLHAYDVSLRNAPTGYTRIEPHYCAKNTPSWTVITANTTVDVGAIYGGAKMAKIGVRIRQLGDGSIGAFNDYVIGTSDSSHANIFGYCDCSVYDHSGVLSTEIAAANATWDIPVDSSGFAYLQVSYASSLITYAVLGIFD